MTTSVGISLIPLFLFLLLLAGAVWLLVASVRKGRATGVVLGVALLAIGGLIALGMAVTVTSSPTGTHRYGPVSVVYYESTRPSATADGPPIARQMEQFADQMGQFGERMGRQSEDFGERMGQFGERVGQFGEQMGRWGEGFGQSMAGAAPDDVGMCSRPLMRRRAHALAVWSARLSGQAEV